MFGSWSEPLRWRRQQIFADSSTRGLRCQPRAIVDGEADLVGRERHQANDQRGGDDYGDLRAFRHQPVGVAD